MSNYSLLFVLLLCAGVFTAGQLVRRGSVSTSIASLIATAAFSLPVAVWVWRATMSARRPGS
jgi:hypothetical protein